MKWVGQDDKKNQDEQKKQMMGERIEFENQEKKLSSFTKNNEI